MSYSSRFGFDGQSGGYLFQRYYVIVICFTAFGGRCFGWCIIDRVFYVRIDVRRVHFLRLVIHLFTDYARVMYLYLITDNQVD